MTEETNNKRFTPAHLAAIGMASALVAVTTTFLKIPTPATGGYLNLGDVVVIFIGFRLGARNGALAGGIGSAIADLIGGYAFFAPVTFLAKGLEGGLAGYLGHNKTSVLTQTVAAFAGASVMVLLYSLWNWTVLGYVPALASVPGNVLQGLAGVTGAVFLQRACRKRSNI
jgi:uncharacterized membrane protein